MSHPIAELVQLPDFRRLWGIGLLTGTLRWLEVLAVSLYTLQVTNSAFIVALMLFARTLPGILFGAFTGTIASRFDRRHILYKGMLIIGATSAILAVLASLGQLTIWQIAAGAVINGTVWTLEHPVRRTLLGDVAGIDRLRNAISLDQFTVNSTRMIGPLIGGALFAALGLTGVYAVSAFGFLTAAILAFTIRVSGAAVSEMQESFYQTLIAGFRYVRAHPVLRNVLLITMIANFFGFSYASMVPVVGRHTFDLSPGQIGVLQSMEGVGATVMALSIALVSFRFNHLRAFVTGAMLFLGGLLVFSLSRHLSLSFFALLAAGTGIATFGSMQSTVLLNTSDPAQRMRVMGLLVMSIGSAPVGVVAMGALAQWLGPDTALATMSGCGLAIILAVVISQRHLFREYGSR